MAARFVIGRAGTGKTHHCLHSIAEQLTDSPITGPRLILLVPEQASLQSERALLDILPTRAAHRAEVLSFQRLAYRILNEVGLHDRDVLTSTGRSMLLRLAMIRCRNRLQYYRSAERFGGFVERMGLTIAECLAETVTPEQLRARISTEDDPTREARLQDVAWIYETYVSLIESNRVDPTQQLETATDNVSRCGWLTGARVWVDGFAGFTGQEQRMLVGLARISETIEITLLIDPQDDAAPSGGALGLFRRTRGTLARVSDALTSVGVSVEKPVVLSSAARRFNTSSMLQSLEHRLFSGSPDVDACDESVQIVEASDRRTEVEYSVARIVEAVQRKSHPLRYRDVAIVVRNLPTYRALLTASLAARGIPFFVDQRRPISKHPLIDLLRCLFDLAIDDYPYGPIRHLLKTGFCPVESRRADALDNYLLATGLNGAERWIQPDWSVPPRHRSQGNKTKEQKRHPMDLIQSARDAIKPLLAEWYSLATTEDKMDGRRWATVLQEIAKVFNCEKTISDWAERADAAGEFELADLHRQTWASFEELCAEFETTLGREVFDVATARLVFDTAVLQWSVGLAPSMLDQVLIGSIERSRNPDLKLAIILGFDDNTFPSPLKEDTILNHGDRSSLREAGTDLGTPRQQHLNDEALLAYIAMTRASQQLLICYARADEKGNELRPSMFLDSVRRILPKLATRKIEDPVASLSDWSILTPFDLAAQVTHAMRHRPIVPTSDPNSDNKADRRMLFNDLYALSYKNTEWRNVMGTATSSLAYNNAASLSPTSVAQLYREPLRASVSSLEAYASCPFRHFANNTLGLQEREIAALQVVDLGTFHHAILEAFVGGVVADKVAFIELAPTEISERLERGLDHVRTNIPLFAELANPHDTFLSSRATHELASIIANQQIATRAGDMRPTRTELAFGFSDRKGLNALEITTPRGRKLLLRGYIDRVDLAETADAYLATVIDYKRTRERTLDLAAAYHGMSLQLLAYLLVLQQQGQSLFGRRIIPVAAFFLPIRERYRRVKHPREADESKLSNSDECPRGLINTKHIDRIESTGSSKWSPVFKIYRNQKGTFGYKDSSDVADNAEFAGMLERTRQTIGQWADRWLDGTIDVRPYRLKSFSPCRYCQFKPVCRYEPGSTPTRRLISMSRTEVMNRVGRVEQSSDG